MREEESTVYVWTKQAEIDFIAKWGHSRPLTRRAGREALYDGRQLNATIASAYAERGWIKLIDEYGGGPVNRDKRIDGLAEDVKRDRWKKLKMLFQRSNKTTLREVSQKMGFADASSLNHFVEVYGIEMVEKYGRLPEPSLSGGRKLSAVHWLRILEAKA
jgi:hypothetical protein